MVEVNSQPQRIAGAKKFENVTVRVSCFGFKRRNEKIQDEETIHPAAWRTDSAEVTQSTVEGKYSPEYDAFVPRDCNSDASTRDEENWEDAAAAEPTSDWEQDTLHYPTPADSEWEREDAQYPTTAYSTTPDRSETGTLETNPEMHDSISSLKETGFDKNALEYSVNTMPVEDPEMVEEAVLDQAWQINPHDIFFCSRSNGKLCKLGKGAFGTVYKGMWHEQTIAVKVCRQQHISTKAMKQFQTEVAILNGCSHENVVEFIGACCWKGGKRTVLVTEFMEKGDLCTALARSPAKFAWDRLGRGVALDIARGLVHLHDRNVVHFDLKSANILLDKNDRAKLADVGLAKTLTNYHGNEQLSTFMATGDLGTFAWAAPEVLLGFSCNFKADIFSFGVVMWELATAEMPQGRCLRPIRVPEEANEEVAEIIMNCLRHDPVARPTAAQLLELLSNIN